MGNGQSAVEDRSCGIVARSKGLPAGKNTGGSSTAPKVDTPSPLLISLPYPQYNDSETVGGLPAKRPIELNHEFRPHIRSQLLSCEEHDPASETAREKADVLAVSLARSLSRPGSRRANQQTPKPLARKLNNNTSEMSLSSERTVDLETAVALLQELRKTATPEDLVALRRAFSILFHNCVC